MALAKTFTYIMGRWASDLCYDMHSSRTTYKRFRGDVRLESCSFHCRLVWDIARPRTLEPS